MKDYKQCKRSHAKYKAKAKRLRHKLLKIEKKRIALGIEMDKQKQKLAKVNEERTRIESLQAFLSDMDLLSEFITKKVAPLPFVPASRIHPYSSGMAGYHTTEGVHIRRNRLTGRCSNSEPQCVTKCQQRSARLC